MPNPVMNGRFALYETPDGGYHIAYQPDGDTEARHLEIPAIVIKMAKASAAGKLNPMTAMREMMGNG